MKILFALNQNSETDSEEIILKEYQNLTGERFEYKKEYDLSGVMKSLQLEHFDLLILNEELERNNYVTTSYIDDLTDKYSIRIIFIVQGSREDNSYAKRLFNIGVYDSLYSFDLDKETLVDLIIRPRTKAVAKTYLGIKELEDVTVESELEIIPEEEFLNILIHFNEIEKERYSDTFDHICSLYNNKQIIYLIKNIPKAIKDILEEANNDNYTNYNEIIGVFRKDEDSREQIIEENNIKEKQIKNKNTKVKKSINILKEGDSQRVAKIEQDYIINVIPDDYRKVVAVIGDRRVGVTSIVSLLAYEYAKTKKVLVVDSTDNGMFKKIALGSENIENKEEYSGLKMDDNLYIIKPKKTDNTLNLIEQFKYKNNIILIETNLDFPANTLKWVDIVLNVVTLDISDLISLKDYLRNAMLLGVNSYKNVLVINKHLKIKITSKDIVNLVKGYIPFIEKENSGVNLNENMFIIPYDIKFYENDLSSQIYAEEKVIGTESININIHALANFIYPISKKKKFDIMKYLGGKR